MDYNIIGDIAGNKLTLDALIAKMPPGEILSLGDPNDRGPRSKEVVEFLMNNGKTVNSNHAHMFIEEWKQSAMPGSSPRYYDTEVFYYNGGIPTIKSYNPKWTPDFGAEIHTIVPREHIKFLEQCPMFIETDNYIMTHAPLHSQLTLEKASDLGSGFSEHYDSNSGYSLLWNRYVPEKPHKHLNGKINIFGHNASDKVKLYTQQYPHGKKISGGDEFKELLDLGGVWGICLDTSSAKVLTGLHLPTMTLYGQEYID